MIMNAAFLVARDQAEHFDAKVHEIGKQFEGKLSFRYTGPWPPYNFRHDPAAARAFGAGLLGRRPLAPRLVRPLSESEEPSRKRFKPLRSPKATTK